MQLGKLKLHFSRRFTLKSQYIILAQKKNFVKLDITIILFYTSN